MKKIRIIIVEDEVIIASDMKRKLEDSGYSVVDMIITGEDAIKRAIELRPDLIFMDIVLAGKIDGIEAACEINRLTEIPVIFLTAHSEKTLLERAKIAKPYGYLLKPFNEREMMIIIEMSLNRYSLENRLKESEERYKRITNAVTDYIYTVKLKDGHPVNTIHGHACIAVTGYNTDEFNSDPHLWIKMIPEEDQNAILDYTKSIIAGELLAPIEHRIIKKDGAERWVKNTIVPHFESNRKILSYDGLIQDITERKNAEEETRKSYYKIRKTLNGTVRAIALAVEARDPYTAGHQMRVVDLAHAIARELNLSQDLLEGLSIAGSIHDLGKIAIPAEILSKPGKLTEIEFNLIKNHPKTGFDILKTIDFPWPIAQIVYQHHERINSSGYPQGLSGENILLEAKIMAVADVVEAMASDRPYRPGLGVDKALEEIAVNKGILYEPGVVNACINILKNKKYWLEQWND